jgi:hypothetical protein
LSKAPPPLLGFNNNVRHQGRVFHIQTEDSGTRRARIVTHLFVDGGRIVRTTRTDYSEHVGREDMVPVLRRLMKEQHKAMFIRLRSGALDDIIDQACGGSAPAGAAAKRSSEAPAEPAERGSAEPTSQTEAAAPPPTSVLPQEDAAAAAKAARSVQVGRPEREQRRLSNPALRRVVPSVPPPAGEIELDVNALERPPPGPSARDDPQSIAALARLRPPPAPSIRAARAASEPPPAVDSPDGDVRGRYAPSRPAAIFGDIPSPQGSIFGDNVISEKSLDEVILSYLADDLDGPSSE